MARLSRTEKAINAGCREIAKVCLDKPDAGVQKAGSDLKKKCIKEYASEYGVSDSTVRRWIKDGKLDYEQPGGKGGMIFLTTNA